MLISLSKNMKYSIIILFGTLSLYITSCTDNAVEHNAPSASYNEIISGNAGEYNIQMFITGADSLTTGYNDVYFKVKKGTTEQNSGLVKMFPKMWMTPRFMHSTPVSPTFVYDNSTGYYKGYAIYIMSTSPPIVVWYSVLTYRDENGIDHTTDSIPTYTAFHREKQWRIFFDSTDQSSYMITLLKPFSPVKGYNDFAMMLHRTEGTMIDYQLITSAQMFMSVYELDSANQSTGNINPTPGADGIYRGRINLPYPGDWNACDTIFYNGHYITNTPPPMPEFNFSIR